MYFSRIILNPFSDNRRLVEMFCHNIYSEHQAIWKFFDGDTKAKRDFLYRQVIENGRVKYYLLSKREPDEKGGLWNIQKKKYDPKLKKGRRLSFMLRANPVTTVSGSNGQKQRHDIVMHEKTRLNYKTLDPDQRPSTQELVQKSGVEWLEKQGQNNGFKAGAYIKVDGYRKHICRRLEGQKEIKFSSIDFEGILEVEDVELFNNALFNGIGKSKSFGCGLILIKKVL